MNTYKPSALLILSTVSTIFAYTESPGPRKGVFFKDRWNRRWFLRASAIRVSQSVAKDAKKLLGKPARFNVSKFDNYTNIRKLSNAIEFDIKSKNPQQKAKKKGNNSLQLLC